ncbi:kinesin-domain-containing protein [Viridothelium virens]|uniref:Kinesin-like protein n=1 Tax=Viridothelium virens TaxID=1048519 RepID=A0A6A6HLI9_VIRVR|nr:kinesin-domain-containing protein [Viridothelium virens]
MDSSILDSDSGNVKVVVRVRKFIKREIERGARCLVKMDPASQKTTLNAPSEIDPANSRSQSRKIFEDKSFTFDKSFWSHNEADAHYAHQEDIYNSFGEEFLDHNFDGYHTCIFAYGQTGSGKSYTMMGSSEQPGLIPRTCEGLFERIESEQSSSITYNVHVSYFEVYNEHVRDLLVARTNATQYLKIRESKADGVYVQNLTDEPVKCYADVERLMRIGDINRTTASTKMNDTSSRSHAVFTIMLKQIQHDMSTDETIERCARMRLVDLAGSERAKSTEATGQRLREGGNINQSLSTLGRVIGALADPKRQRRGSSSSGKASRTRDVVPYRDSVLTWLLKDSLGGNSKTAMVACIAPSDYDETLSTLRYADQAKRIRTRATVNQDAVTAAERDAKILSMQETIRTLQNNLNAAATRKREDFDRQATELEDYQKQVQAMQRLMEETRQVSECKIRALTNEVEELRPLNETLEREISSLRRHLGLVVGELKNPIRLPIAKSEPDSGVEMEGDKENVPVEEYEEDEDEGYHDGKDEVTHEVHTRANDILKDLALFRKKMADDRSRFGVRGPLGETQGN